LGDDGRLVELWGEPVEPVPEELLSWLDQAGPVAMGGQLLE
jgi:hypothetical protein